MRQCIDIVGSWGLLYGRTHKYGTGKDKKTQGDVLKWKTLMYTLDI